MVYTAKIAWHPFCFSRIWHFLEEFSSNKDLSDILKPSAKISNNEWTKYTDKSALAKVNSDFCTNVN